METCVNQVAQTAPEKQNTFHKTRQKE